MRNLLRKTLLVLPGVAAATLLGAGGVAGAAPAGAQTEPVQTMSCSHSHSNKDSGEGRAKTDLRYRTGPHTSCAAPGQVSKGTLIYYHCWTAGGEAGGKHTWTWGRIAGTQTAGWFADAYLSDGGATKQC
ncbi:MULTISPECIES: SH3 domain-containing protein [unclassified Amycolatopsis]|uniref:SH3 domain-containing protein n=1 Tax=unclassified Amycolatopsis TaxID=2618356 RepID=UPI000F7B36EE|nr:SH3 domain-containing protein [Amycolatopsis sp. WAC 01376]